MLRRKIEALLDEWRQAKDRKPIVIKGCRQCGKTFSVLRFARQHYRNVVYLNFMEEPSYAVAFSESLSVDNIVMNITSLMGDAIFEPGKTCCWHHTILAKFKRFKGLSLVATRKT